MTSLHNYKTALQRFQTQRLRRDHADLAAEPQYQAISEFFFEEMYGLRDFSARDAQAHRLHHFLHLAPGLAANDIEQVLQLLELTNQLDQTVAQWLLALDAPLDLDEATYDRAYRLADNYAARSHQIALIRHSLYNVYRLARKPLLGITLRRTQALAHAVGMADIHRFLRIGYQALQPVRDIHRFVETVCLREHDRLDRIYKLPQP